MSDASDHNILGKSEPGGRTPGTCADYCRISGLSLNSVRAAIQRSDIETLRIGRRILIVGRAFDELAGVS